MTRRSEKSGIRKNRNGSGNGFFREENYNYTKEFELDPKDKGKNIYFEFEGVYQNAFVYINHAFAGKMSVWLRQFLY